jgi:hypothetical protein
VVHGKRGGNAQSSIGHDAAGSKTEVCCVLTDHLRAVARRVNLLRAREIYCTKCWSRNREPNLNIQLHKQR